MPNDMSVLSNIMQEELVFEETQVFANARLLTLIPDAVMQSIIIEKVVCFSLMPEVALEKLSLQTHAFLVLNELYSRMMLSPVG